VGVKTRPSDIAWVNMVKLKRDRKYQRIKEKLREALEKESNILIIRRMAELSQRKSEVMGLV